jgi:murein DD-endopeptidase MepM/ murein hydrolase activator NlpD
MAFKIRFQTRLINHTRGRLARLARQAGESAVRAPAVAMVVLLATGAALGAGLHSGIGSIEMTQLRHRSMTQQTQLDATRDQAQREVNALAARLGELQAQANRLNALGERLTRTGHTHDMPARDLRAGLAHLETRFKASGEQLSVLDSLLFNRKLDAESTPSRMPIANSYVTSGFGGRADPFGGGAAFHKGMDFHAVTGDPVLAVADGVVSYAGVRSGYGNVVEVDHGNGYVTRYAHNSRLLVQVGDLVRSGQQVAKAGSTGHSTGAHVHFEVWVNGVVVNPAKFLGQAGVTRG